MAAFAFKWMPSAVNESNHSWIYAHKLKHVQATPFSFYPGKQLQSIQFPGASWITSCCWGGRHYDELYVTSARSASVADEEEYAKEPNAGSLFRVTGLGVKGLPGCDYQG